MLSSCKQLQDAVYFLECVIDALGGIRVQLLGELRASLQRIYPKFTTAFEYSPLSTTREAQALPSSSGDAIVTRDNDSGHRDDSDDEKEEVEERGQAESIQFLALRNKLRQCTKTILLTSSAGSGLQSSSGAAYSSSKLD